MVAEQAAAAAQQQKDIVRVQDTHASNIALLSQITTPPQKNEAARVQHHIQNTSFTYTPTLDTHRLCIHTHARCIIIRMMNDHQQMITITNVQLQLHVYLCQDTLAMWGATQCGQKWANDVHKLHVQVP